MKLLNKPAFPWAFFCGLLIFMNLWQSAHAQNVLPSYVPQPYVAIGGSLMPNGYSPFAFRGQAGVYEDYKHLVSDIFIAIDNGKKTNDGTLNNIKGHDDYANAFLAYRPGTNTYYGFGPRWSQLVTSNYTKGTNLFQSVRSGDFRVQAVAGHDWLRSNFSMRGQVNYVFPPFHESVAYPASSTSPPSVCSGCGNGVQGPELTVMFPSPSLAKKHWFFRETLGIYEFHTTITEPSNLPLTQQQDSSRHAMATADFTVMYRF